MIRRPPPRHTREHCAGRNRNTALAGTAAGARAKERCPPMHGPPILKDLVIVLTAALAAVYGLRRARLPTIVAFLVAGVLIGPGGLGLVRDRGSIETIAELGVALLLFSVGLKLSLRGLGRMGRQVLGGGGLQTALTIAATVALGRLFGVEAQTGVFYGYMLAMSSTAIFLLVLEERGETDSAHGRLGVNISVFQDLATVPMVLSLPLLARAGGPGWEASLLTLAKSLGMVVAIILAARFVFPWLIERAVRSRSREAFTLTTILVALGTAWLGAQAGLSLPLGAFLAGLVVSDSEYSQQVLAEIGPLRDALGGLFFISVGMLAEPALWLHRPLEFLGLSLGVMLGKALIIFGVTLLLGLSARVGVLAGVGLSDIGEFSFILAQSGAACGLIGGERYQQFLAISVLTMALTPFAMLLAPRLAEPAARVAWPSLPWTPSTSSAPAAEEPAEAGAARRGDAVGAAAAEAAGAGGAAAAAAPGHVVIVGYGLNGGNVARVLRGLGIPVVVLELNPATVRRAQARGESVVYGDATNREVLRHTGIERARALVIAIADPVASRQIVAVARAANPGLTVIVRARYVAEVEALHRAGADVVVPEEFETSLELAGAAMATFGASPRMIEREKAAIREERYASLAAEGRPVAPHLPLSRLFGAADVAAVDLPPASLAAGSTLRELDLRGRTGASVVALARDDEVLGNPGPDLVLRGGDVLYIWGDARQLAQARAVLEREAGPAAPVAPA